MDDPLAIYLHDYLAGSGFAIELLEKLASEFRVSETEAKANQILSQVRADRSVLGTLISRTGNAKRGLWEVLECRRESDERVAGQYQIQVARTALGLAGELCHRH